MNNNRLTITLSALLFAFGLLYTSIATATLISEVEPNNTAATVQDVSGFFNLGFNPNIGGRTGDITGPNTSRSIPHVSILATGGTGPDWYTFTTISPGIIILDIDGGPGCTDGDTVVWLWNSSGHFIAGNDDSPLGDLDPGSECGDEAFLQTDVFPAGQYFATVCEFSCPPRDGFFIDDPYGVGHYELQISANAQVTVPEPTTFALIGVALVGIEFARRTMKEEER